MRIAMIVVMMNSDFYNLFPDTLLFILSPCKISVILMNSLVEINVSLLNDQLRVQLRIQVQNLWDTTVNKVLIYVSIRESSLHKCFKNKQNFTRIIWYRSFLILHKYTNRPIVTAKLSSDTVIWNLFWKFDI